MDVKDFNKKVDSLLQGAIKAIKYCTEQAAISLNSSIKDRITTRGTDAFGKKFFDYSEGYKQFKTDVGRYRGFVDFQLGNYSINRRISAIIARKKDKKKKMKADGKKSKSKILSGKEKKELIKQRRAKAIPKSSTLMSDIQITSKKDEGSIYIVRIAPKSDLNRKKAEKIAKKWGNILAPSKSELEAANKTARKAFEIRLKESGEYRGFAQ